MSRVFTLSPSEKQTDLSPCRGNSSKPMNPNKTLATALALAFSAWPLVAQDRPQPRPAREPHLPERAPDLRRDSTQRREGEPRREEPRREVQRPMAGLFSALDANHDGMIDETERRQAADVLRRLDQNGDGKVGPDELGAIGGQQSGDVARNPQARDTRAGTAKEVEHRGANGTRLESRPKGFTPDPSWEPERRREFAQKANQPAHQSENRREHRGPGEPNTRQPQASVSEHGNFRPPGAPPHGPKSDASHREDSRNAGDDAKPQPGPGQRRDAAASPDRRQASVPQVRPRSGRQGRNFDRGWLRTQPRFAQNFDHRMRGFAQRGGPRQPGWGPVPQMGQERQGPPQMGPRPPQRGGPQMWNFNGPRGMNIAPQFGQMRRPFGMPGQHGSWPQPQKGFQGPQNPQGAAKPQMKSNQPGPQGRGSQHPQHDEGSQQQLPQHGGGRPRGPMPK